MKKNNFVVSILGLVAAMALMNGCSDSQTDTSTAHGHAHDGDADHAHADDNDQAPPHGGTPVLIGEDAFHLELVLDPSAAKVQAYVLDGHLESYVNVPETNFTMVASTGEGEHRLEFRRAADSSTGAVPESSSLFEAQADWLNGVTEFDGRIPSITLQGTTFTNITFSFPQGTTHVH